MRIAVIGGTGTIGRAVCRTLAVSPTWVTETLQARGVALTGGMPADQVALAYVESVEGTRTGQVLDTRMFRSLRK